MGNAVSIGREIRADLSKTISTALILATEELRDATPVDTTNAANNWMVTSGAPYDGVYGSPQAPSSAMQDQLISAMKRYDVGRDGKGFIKNNVLYLQFLDRGSSQQAEAGFVAAVLQGAAVRRAPAQRRASVRKMLKGMSRHAYLKTY